MKVLLLGILLASCTSGPDVKQFVKANQERVFESFIKEETKINYDSIYVLGDSLSDNGNLHSNTLGIYAPDWVYYKNRFSNGPLWIDYVAATLDLKVTNFAVAGAETGDKSGFDGLFVPGSDAQLEELGDLVKEGFKSKFSALDWPQ